MAASELNNAIFQDEHKAREWLEGHLWAEGRFCGYCGTLDNSTPIASRPGYYQCNAKGCRKQFTVQVGTVFERSHIPLNKWLMASFLMCSSKKGISAHQMHRILGVSYKSAWFMMHRLREAMRDGFNDPLGGAGKVIEADETYIGRKKGFEVKRGTTHKNAVMTFKLTSQNAEIWVAMVCPSQGGKAAGYIMERTGAFIDLPFKLPRTPQRTS